MRHQVKGYKLGRTADRRKALLRSLAISIILHEQIKTTKIKAKAVQPMVERLISQASRNDLATKRLLMKRLANHQLAVRKLMELIGPRFANRPGGYTRLLKAGNRPGDNADVVFLSLVEQTTPAEAEKFLAARSANKPVAKPKAEATTAAKEEVAKKKPVAKKDTVSKEAPKKPAAKKAAAAK
jgi:large subunit ribosomal protein L17